MTFVSTIVPTINRPTLSRAVRSVLDQDFVNGQYEIIVVNDSGKPLPEMGWMESPRVRLINTQRRNRSVARNAGAAIAKGKYLHFLDDDDWMMPGAFDALWELSLHSQATWLCGAFRLVDDKGVVKSIELNEAGNCFVQLMAGEWIPLQASLIMSDPFFSIGGFAALQTLLGGSEDIDLCRMVNHRFQLAFTSTIVASISSGERASTTDCSNTHAQLRQSREKALDLPGSFARMRAAASATKSAAAYWNGRIVYFYLASMFHNVFRQNRVFTALSRGLFSLAAFLLSGNRLFEVEFWRGIRQGYVPLS